MSSLNSSSERPPKNNKYDCLDCENYKRKVKEAEQTVSGRDVLIEMLQGEIKKLEQKYKASIDDYEALRFKYCTVVQDLSNLKEIHKKLERSNTKLNNERDIAISQVEALTKQVEACKKQCESSKPNDTEVEAKPNVRDTDSYHQAILKEVINIEAIMQNQSEAVKAALVKVIKDVNGDKDGKQIEEALEKEQTYKTLAEKAGNKEDMATTIENLNQQIEDMNVTMAKLKEENESIKSQLAEKKTNLSQCLDVLEDNHSNLNNLSGNIELIINEKEAYLKEIENLKDIIEEKEKEIYVLKSTNPKSNDLQEENENLRKSLKRTEKELERFQEEYLKKDKQCTGEKCRQLAQTMLNSGDIESLIKREMKSKLQSTRVGAGGEIERLAQDLQEAEDALKIASQEYQMQIDMLNEKIKVLEEQVDHLKLENSEYEEENKFYSQKIENLAEKLQQLTIESEINNKNVTQIDQLKQQLEELGITKEREIKQLKDELNNLMRNNQEAQLKEKILQMDFEYKATNEEKDKLLKEREQLKNQLINLQNEMTVIKNNEEKKMITLQEKINKLESLENQREKETANVYWRIEKMDAEYKAISQEKDEALKENEQLVKEREQLKYQLINLQNEMAVIKNEEKKMITLQEKINKLESLENQREKETANVYWRIEKMDAEYKAISQEKDEALKENEQLKKQLINLQNEIRSAQNNDEKKILQLQDKINRLETSEQAKEKEIDQCCCVMKALKKSIADKNHIDENILAKISLLENQKLALEKDNRLLQEQITAFKTEISSFQNTYKDCQCSSGKYEEEMKEMESINMKLKQELNELEVEMCKRDCLSEKLQNDIKDMEMEICRRQCTINHLEQCLDKSNKILAECEKEMKEMHSENESLKKENESLKDGKNSAQEVQSLKDQIKNYAEEVEFRKEEQNSLQQQVKRFSRHSQDLELEKFKLAQDLQNKANLEDELNQLKTKYNNLLKTTQEKDDELQAARKQIEAMEDAIETSKREQEKIMRAYKEVKETLSNEIKKYNQETEKMSAERENIKIEFKTEAKCAACLNVKELNSIVVLKENTIKSLERQNQELSTEAAQLKAYVNNLMANNKTLRTAIDNLLATLAEKLKSFTENEEKISLKSNELIVRDILNSLIDLEKHVKVVSSSPSPEKCNCMSVIMSTYNPKDPKGRCATSCRLKCTRKIRDMSNYMNAKVGSNNGAENIVPDCCKNREKGEDDIPESENQRPKTRSISDTDMGDPDDDQD